MAILKAQKGTKTDLSTGLSDKEMIRQRNRRHFDSIMTPEVQEQLAGAAMGSVGVLSKVGAAPDAMAKGVGYLINKAKPVFSKAKLAAGVPTIPNKTLYRVDNPNVQFKASQTANGDIQAKYAGQFFTDNPKDLASYASKYARMSKDTPGMRFSSVAVPEKDLPKYLAKNIPEMKGMDIEPNDWMIPESITRQHIPVTDPSVYYNQFKNAELISKLFGGQ
jgi:hypothetical protein